jgi:hypothetical protein
MDAGGKHMYAAIRVAWKLGFVIGCNVLTWLPSGV